MGGRKGTVGGGIVGGAGNPIPSYAEQYCAVLKVHSAELGSASQASHGHSVVAKSAGGQVNAQLCRCCCCCRRWRRVLLTASVDCCVIGEEVAARRGTSHEPHAKVAFDATCTFPVRLEPVVRLLLPRVVAAYAAARPLVLRTSLSTRNPAVRPAGSPSSLRYQSPFGSSTSTACSCAPSSNFTSF